MEPILVLTALFFLFGGGEGEPEKPPECPEGQLWDPRAKKCRPAKPDAKDCRPGHVWNPQTRRCELPDVDDPDKPDPTKPDPAKPDPEKPAPNLPATIHDYPTVGGFYQVVQGDQLAGKTSQGGIAHRAIAGEVYRAAIDRGASHESALISATNLAVQHRAKYIGEIQGDTWNDHVYGTYGYGPKAMPSPLTARALRMTPYHAPNRERMMQGQPPIRSIRLSTENNAKQGTGKTAPGAPGGNLELLWLPPFDAVQLLDSDILVVDRSYKPEWLTPLGVVDKSGAPKGTRWGRL